jgi:hypothetical protein
MVCLHFLTWTRPKAGNERWEFCRVGARLVLRSVLIPLVIHWYQYLYVSLRSALNQVAHVHTGTGYVVFASRKLTSKCLQ